HEFYAFDALTGKKLWLYRTGDDGPTAAVVEDGYVAFNTESCELEIITMDGKRVWKKWLGDPLMSMPAISKGRVYMAYPDTKGDLVWSEKKNATSSPAVYNGKVYFSQRMVAKTKDKDGKECEQQMEALAGRGTSKDGKILVYESTKHAADYLDWGKRAAGSPVEKMNKGNDAGVGFAGGAPAAKLEQAQMNLGQATVAGVWSYQGSRPFVYKGKLVSAMGDTIKCVDPKDEKVLWTRELHPNKDKKPVVDFG